MSIQNLFTKRILFVTGKGGVGKSTVTATLGLLASRMGLKTLICEFDRRPTFSKLFDVADQQSLPVALDTDLSYLRIDPDQALRDFLGRFIPIKKLASALLKNRLVQTFLKAAPAVNEAVILDRLWSLSLEKGTEKRNTWDLILADLPATGHAVTFLKIPEVLAKLMPVGRLGERFSQIDRWVKAPELSGVLLVSLPEELPLKETIQLWGQLEDFLGRPPEGVLINGIRQPPVSVPCEELLQSLADEIPADSDSRENADHPLAKLLEGAQIGLQWSNQDRKQVQKLRSSLPGPFLELPFWSGEKLKNRAVIEALAEHLKGLSGPDICWRC